MNFEKVREVKKALRADEAAGKVADSLDVRKALMARFHSGEITLEQAQQELAKIKRGAKSNGQSTRASYYR